MNSFLAVPPTTTTSAPSDDDVIVNDGWFPDLSMAAMREAMRVDGTITPARLRPALVSAILDANRQLADWQAQQQAAGRDKLEAVPAPHIDGCSMLVARYLRAVYSTAKADLTERYRDFDSTAEGLKKAEALDAAIDEQRRNAHWAIADIIGRPRSTVELI
ncbi:MAG: head completion/stabilization protein [Burkholderiaceae bacterium]